MTNRLLTSLLTSFLALNATAASPQGRPRLVVNIVVDQLRTDYLEHLQGILGQGGFNRLMRQGAYMRDLEFKTADPDIANASAVLSTGAWPAASGVPSAYIYDPSLKRLVKALDESGTGADRLSPARMHLSTLSDEIAVGSNGLSLIYSIAADPQQAVILGGHSANAAIWLDPSSARWVTSPYYHELPQAAAKRNIGQGLNGRLDTMRWRPALAPSQYIGLTPAQTKHPFDYSFSRSKEGYSSFLASPMANREVTDLAIDCLRSLNLGTRYSGNGAKAEALGEPLDMLNIGYSLAGASGLNADCSFEQQDSYVRLDGQLARLFEAIDRQVGLDKSLVVLSSTGYYNEPATDLSRFRIPSGEFSSRKALSLLNSYLSARYGNADYVSTIADGRVYLDHKSIESRGINLDETTLEARNFLRRMSGVAGAYTISEILSPSGPDTSRLSLSVDPRTGGDVIIVFTPGWEISDDISYPPHKRTFRTSATVTPAFIMGPGVKGETISTPVDATALTPTVCQILRIRSPNGASGRPILFGSPQ